MGATYFVYVENYITLKNKLHRDIKEFLELNIDRRIIEEVNISNGWDFIQTNLDALHSKNRRCAPVDFTISRDGEDKVWWINYNMFRIYLYKVNLGTIGI